MPSIKTCRAPQGSLLASYAARGAFTDCYSTEMPGVVSQAQYVEAFYTTWVFRLERAILAFAVSRPSTDDDARRLAAGTQATFSAWRVESRGENQLLMADFKGRTRSWLMVAPVTNGGEARTRLYFGSAVLPVRDVATGGAELPAGFHPLLGFHKLYSRVLLRAAKSRLKRGLTI